MHFTVLIWWIFETQKVCQQSESDFRVNIQVQILLDSSLSATCHGFSKTYPNYAHPHIYFRCLRKRTKQNRKRVIIKWCTQNDEQQNNEITALELHRITLAADVCTFRILDNKEWHMHVPRTKSRLMFHHFCDFLIYLS